MRTAPDSLFVLFIFLPVFLYFFKRTPRGFGNGTPDNQHIGDAHRREEEERAGGRKVFEHPGRQLPDEVGAHSASPAIDIASPRTRVGYISESSTHTTAQIETAQQKI